jgi:hypothetical protein
VTCHSDRELVNELRRQICACEIALREAEQRGCASPIAGEPTGKELWDEYCVVSDGVVDGPATALAIWRQGYTAGRAVDCPQPAPPPSDP